MAVSRLNGRWSSALLTPTGLVALAGLAVMLFLVIFAPVIWGDISTTTDPTALSRKPDPSHPFGTDAGGRDVFARTMVAARLSVLMALAASAMGVLGGALLGALPSVLPPSWGRMILAGVNFALAFPGLLITVVLSVIFGQGIAGAVFAIGLAILPAYARLTSTLAASVAGRDFVAAARVLGVSRTRLLLRHVMPNIAAPLIVNASVTAGGALTAFAGLSYLGLGVQQPDFDWGRMLNEGLLKIFVNPATALAPGVAVVVSGIIFTLVGETIARATGVTTSLSDRLPRLRPRDLGPEVPGNDNGAVLQVRDLRIAAPSRSRWLELVRGVSFDVERGELVGLVGESGSGKSLTCMAVAQLAEHPLHISAQTIRFDGREIYRGSAPTRPGRAVSRLLGTRLAMVFQDPMSSLNPSMRVGGQVAEPGFLHGGHGRRAAWAKGIQRLSEVKIADPERRARQYPHELSGGMRQRAMIAMGLMGKPALIIADEPTTALDVTVQREVLSVLHDVHQETGAAVLMISHDIAVITGFCTRVMIMYRGQIVENISTEDLVAGKARHPYTQALLAAVPTLETDRTVPMPTIVEGADFDADLRFDVANRPADGLPPSKGKDSTEREGANA
ncbi:dipeptide/oligopeptide/nickel ABC transporter permease/ATP-binding protein [Paenarthrobacter sp. NPDC090517]|uniref:dipeptide/oligopeptide/nickel ABC transporter permease/ATP-binding protein n=1 Tax=Paenarthrobacter sp. NPDC090517 TaxID=3364381 RepID=UPI0038108FEF